MGIEYLSGITPGMKIELEPTLRPEKILPFLKEKLAYSADEYNREYNCQWLDAEGSIISSQHQDWDTDGHYAKEQEVQWAKEYGKSREQWLRDKEKNPSNLTEMALTLSLQRLLPPQFIVVRTAKHDDYNNGVDKLIIDKETGSVVCGIDEVVDLQNLSSPSIKEKKVREKMLHGGARVKYGAKVEKGELKLKSLRDIPAFYLSLNKKELINLCESLNGDEPNADELALMSRLNISLHQQIASYANLPLSDGLRANILLFEQSLATWPK